MTPRLRGGAGSRRLSVALVVVAAIVGFASIFATWVKRQALETDTWTQTSSAFLQNTEIRGAVADFVVAQLYENVDVQNEIETLLPSNLKGLAGPAAAGVRRAAGDVARQALAQPRVQAAWEDANRVAHEQLVALIDDKSEFVSTTGGSVSLDLRSIASDIAAEVGLPADIADQLPSDAAQLEILRSSQLEAVQAGASVLRTLDWLLLIAVVVLFGLAIYVAGPGRRAALRNVGIAFVLVGVLTLLLRSLLEGIVVGGLTDTAAAEGPVRATWDIATANLRADGVTVIGYGAVILFGAWLAGPAAAATSIRRAAAPYLRQAPVAYLGLATVVALLLWWNPAVDTRRLLPSLILIGLLVLGVETLRRQVIREFPESTTKSVPDVAP